ncbi:MAG: metallophosphoesterase [Clostridia bacterium]|nr:metallophosphoesterase [Clostridia bacterium]
MELNHRFPQTELLRYRHVPYQSGEPCLLVMASLMAKGAVKPDDYALRGKISRDGLEAFLFREETLRKKQNDKDLYWIVTDEGDGKVSLWSVTAKKYVTIDEHGARFSRKKQVLDRTENGAFLRFSRCDKKGTRHYLRCAGRPETASTLVFTSGESDSSTSFACLKRAEKIPAKTENKPLLTAGTFADIHVDYGIQLFRPYLRKSAIQTAKGYAKRFDLDAVIMCGDNISDNGSGSAYPRGGAMQGKWPYDRWLRTRNLLNEALKKSFRDPAKAKNIFYLTGNHESQCGDRQPEGKTYNSGYYTDLLPRDILHPLTEKVQVGLGSDEFLLCYEYRVNGYPFLMLNNPVYPLIPGRSTPERPQPAHTQQQAEWLCDRLAEIEKEQGDKAVIFVTSHFPFIPGYYNNTEGCVPSNYGAFQTMEQAMNRFPNLFFFCGHTHGGDHHPVFRRTAEKMQGNSPVAINVTQKDGKTVLELQDAFERGRFCSDVVLSMGYRHNYGGSMSFYYNHYFANDGRKKPSWLTHLEVPFFQGCAVQVYEDRVVLSMQNFGTKAGVKDYLPDAAYKLKPLVIPLAK